MPPRSLVRWWDALHEVESLVSVHWQLSSPLIPISQGRHTATLTNVQAPVEGDNWLTLVQAALPISEAYEWAVRPDCGAVVLFSGTVRDHADGRDDVQSLTYEAYAGQTEQSFADVVDEVRRRWPTTGRVAIWHRSGELSVGESSVVVVVSAPHRAEAFAAGRFAIDAVKASAPIWKKESWAGGTDWGTGATDITTPSGVPSAASAGSAGSAKDESVEGGAPR